jgi:transcriptional regulator with XRE-family HTH domain
VVDFGQTLLEVSKENGWNQTDLAKLLGYADSSHVSRVVAGKRPVGAQAVDKIVRALRGQATDAQRRRLLRAAGLPDELPEDPRRRLDWVLGESTMPPENARVAREILGPLLGLLGAGPLPAELLEALRTATAGLLRLAELAAGRPA